MTFRRGVIGVLIPAVTIGVFAVLLAFSLMRLSQIERDMHIEATQNMLWVIARTQVGSLQVQKAASLRAEGHHDGAEVEARLNHFLSHYNLLNHGPQKRQMVKMGFSEELDRVEAQRAELTGLISNLAAGDTASLSRIHDILAPYDAMLARAANMAMVDEWNSLGDQLEKSRTEISYIIISLIVIALAGAGMTLYLISASRRAHARARLLEREKAFSELLVVSSSAGIIACDLERRCTLWNDAAGALFNVAAEQASFRPLAEISSFFGGGSVEDTIRNALDGAPTVLSDQPFIGPGDAAPAYLDLRCFPLREGADIIGSIMLIADVTEQYEARRELSDRRDYLEEQVLLRTQELNAALDRERATTSIYRNFAAMVSHQFRTPLAIVDSSLQRLMRRADRLSAGEIVARGEDARSAISRLVRLVESTLDVARLDSGQLSNETRRWDIRSLIEDAIRRQTEETPDRIFNYTDTDSVVAHCDRTHTEHIIANLLANGAKHAPPGTPIQIESVTSGHSVGLRVINEGRIAPEDHKHLFERYFRGSNVREKSGVGLGLYMARSLARLQGGDICFEETPEGRIAFTLFLPTSGHVAPSLT